MTDLSQIVNVLAWVLTPIPRLIFGSLGLPIEYCLALAAVGGALGGVLLARNLRSRTA